MIAFAAAALVHGSAASADLGLRPTISEAFAGPWGGVYIGGAFAAPNGSWSVSGPTLSAFPVVQSALNAAGSGATNGAGAVIGLEGGWNVRLPSNIVIGADLSAEYSSLMGQRSASGIIPLFGVPYSISSSFAANWQGAARARAGYAFGNFALGYVEAGPALANIHYANAFSDAAAEYENTTVRALRLGLSVAVGAEFSLTDRLTLKAEYVYSQFPSLSGVGTAALDDGTTAVIRHNSGALRESELHIGLNYYLK